MISVVIPAYNAEQHIERSLRSVCEQTYGNFEVIVVDDGSTDRTAEIVESWPDRRVKLVQQANAGVSAARNRGIQEAKSEWIAFIDADDRWKPTFLETVVKVSERYPGALAVFTNFENSMTDKPVIPEASGDARMLDCYFSFVLENRQGMWSSCSLIRRDALLAVGGFPVGVTHGEDLDTWARLAWTGPIAYVPEVLAVYHTETEGSAMKAPLEKRLRYPEVVKTFYEWKASGKVPEDKLPVSEKFAQRYLYSYVASLLLTGAKRKAREILFRECSVAYSPWRYFRFVATSFMPKTVYLRLYAISKRIT